MTAKKKDEKKRGITMCFAGYPWADAYEIQYERKKDENGNNVLDKNKPLRDESGQEVKKKAKKGGQLPWGFVVFDTGNSKHWVEKKKKVKYIACHPRNPNGGIQKTRTVWIREDQLQKERCLEVVFVDIGQGDGCYLVAPGRQVDEPRRMVIDAGEHSNMRHYLNWRHGSRKATSLEAAIISHPDADHYKGFEKLFERDNFFFETIYTNGLMERNVDDAKKQAYKAAKKAKKTPLPPDPTALGPVQKFNGTPYVTDLVTNKAELEAFLKQEKNWVTKSIDRKMGLRLKSVAGIDDLESKGKSLVIVALVGSLLHIRIFDASGAMLVDKSENELDSGKKRAYLKKLMSATPIPKVSDFSEGKVKGIIERASAIAGYTLPKRKDGKQFPSMLNEALEGWKRVSEGRSDEREVLDTEVGTMGNFRMISADDKWLPGYEPSDQGEKKDKELTIRVLGPVTETIPGKNKGRPMLRRLDSNDGKTKNGHSVVLKLQYGNVSMMLGGDLNIPSEHLLMSHHTGMESPPDLEHEAAFVEATRQVFQVDIAKSCHHGSSDFTHWFLRALNPVATVISSGDNEPHSHPRSDTLGAIGFHSRSHPRPLIFSTELARSAKDSNQKPWELRAEIMDEVEDILKAKPGPAQDARKQKLKEKLVKDIPRSVAVYGAITVVTDGKKVIIYQKLERKGSHGSYDIYRLEPSGKDESGPLIYQSKH